MKAARLILVVLSYLFCYGAIYSQNRSIDSLISAITRNHHDTIIVTCYNALAHEYLSINSDSAIHYGKIAVQKSLEIKYDKGRAEALRHITQAYINSGQYDPGLAHANLAQQAHQELDDMVGVAEVYNQMAVIWMYRGMYDSAIALANQGLDLFGKKSDQRGEAASLNILGNIAQKKGDYPLASDFLHKALAINQAIGNTSGVVDALNNIGVIYEYQEDYDKALKNYQESYLGYKKLGDNLGVAIGLHNAGIILKKTGNYDSAIYNFKAALILDTETGALDGVAYDNKELGETYLLSDNYETAYMYLHRARALSEAFHDPVVTVPTLIGLGNIHKKYGNYDSAQFYLIYAMDNAKRSELKNEQKDAARSLYKLYEETKNLEKAFEFYHLYNKLKDELFNEENIRKLALVEAEYAFEQKRREQEIQVRLDNIEKNRQVARAFWIRNTSIAGILVISVLAGMIYFNYRRKRIANEKLYLLNEELKAANAEIKNINASLETKINERTELLQEQNEKLKKYIYSNSHEVRGPLSRILALVDLYKTGGDEPQDINFINENIYESAQELDKILKDINKTLKI